MREAILEVRRQLRQVGGLARYGLDDASLAAVNPRLVYCSITGFGQDGPYAHRAGYDLLVQGMSGIMDITGPADGEPMRLGVAFADVFTGVYSALAITAALKERETTGKGSVIDMALLDSLTDERFVTNPRYSDPFSAPSCAADCDLDEHVTTGDVRLAVETALGRETLSHCVPADANGDGQITVDELVAATKASMGEGCPS